MKVTRSTIAEEVTVVKEVDVFDIRLNKDEVHELINVLGSTCGGKYSYSLYCELTKKTNLLPEGKFKGRLDYIN